MGARQTPDSDLAGMTILGIAEWREYINKDMTRRNWATETHNLYCDYVGGLIRVGRVVGGEEYVFGVVRILDVYRQILGDMPVTDVVREGGEEGESVEHFVTRFRKHFVKRRFIVPKVRGTGTKTELRVSWDFEYTVVCWEWVERW
jgi:hypothetical protein